MSWMIVIALCVVPLLAVMTYVLWREECDSASGEDAIADWERPEGKTQSRVSAPETSSDRTLEYA